MERITMKQLEGLCDTLNRITDSPITSYTRDETGKLRANVGNYHIYSANGGVQLHRINNKGGGVTVPIPSGCTTKRDLYNQIHAYINGLWDSGAIK